MEPEKTIEEGEARPGRSAVWIRGLFMLLFLIAFGLGQVLLWLTGLVQFLWLLFAREPSGQLAKFGSSLSNWLAETARFVSCASDDKPFPWAPWPPG